MKTLIRYLDDILLILGIVFLTIGAFMIFTPAGYITLGICFIAYAFIFAKSAVKRGGD